MRVRPNRAKPVIPRACGVSSMPRLLGSIIAVSGMLDHPHAQVTTASVWHLHCHSQTWQGVPAAGKSARGLHEHSPSTKREQGMPGARCTRGLVCKVHKRNAHTSIQVQRRHSGIPCAMALRLMPCSPRRANSSCHRRYRLDGTSDPVGSTAPPIAWHQQRVSGPHGFAVRRNIVRLRAAGLLTSRSPPCNDLRARRCRVHRIPCPTTVTIMIRPSCGPGWGELVEMICPTAKGEYFYEKGWTEKTDLPGGRTASLKTDGRRAAGMHCRIGVSPHKSGLIGMT
jgi:hypothetical protein